MGLEKGCQFIIVNLEIVILILLVICSFMHDAERAELRAGQEQPGRLRGGGDRGGESADGRGLLVSLRLLFRGGVLNVCGFEVWGRRRKICVI